MRQSIFSVGRRLFVPTRTVAESFSTRRSECVIIYELYTYMYMWSWPPSFVHGAGWCADLWRTAYEFFLESCYSTFVIWSVFIARQHGAAICRARAAFLWANRQTDKHIYSSQYFARHPRERGGGDRSNKCFVVAPVAYCRQNFIVLRLHHP